MENVILIGDERVRKIQVEECGEPIVDLRIAFPELNFDLERTHVQKQSESITFARKIIGEKLLQAEALLPPGIKLLIKECYRPMWVQKIFWDGYYIFLKEKCPEWTEKQIYDECSKLNAPLDIAPHTTGGAVDLTLTDSSGEWLEMGTAFNASPLETANATYTAAENISQEAKNNRKLLIEVMTVAGFVNYPTEWWHWSYGDKYWALLSGKSNALFSSQEIETQNEKK